MKWNGRRVRLVVLSGALYTTAALGVYHTWINPDQPGPVKAQSNQQPKKVVEYVSTAGADWKAVHFVSFWLGGNIEEAQNYTAKGFELPAEGPKPKKDVSVFPWGTEFVGDGKLEVMVRVNDGKSIQFLMVPMAEEGGKYGVTGVPVYVPDPGAPKARQSETIDATDDVQLKRKITAVVESFFRQYTKGTPEDMALLYADGKKRRVLSGSSVEFDSITELEVGKEKDNRVKCQVEAQFKVDGKEIPQVYELVYKKDGGRWLLEKTQPELPVIP